MNGSTATDADPQECGDPAHLEATVVEVVSSTAEARADIDTFSYDATTNFGDERADQSVAGILADSRTELTPSNWLLDDSFANILDDCSLNPIPSWFEPYSLHESSQPTSPIPILPSSRNGTKCPTTLDLRQMWYVQVRNSIKDLDDHCESSGKHLATTLRPDIDEVYRTNIANELLAQPYNASLPSIDFMVSEFLTPSTSHVI